MVRTRLLAHPMQLRAEPWRWEGWARTKLVGPKCISPQGVGWRGQSHTSTSFAQDMPIPAIVATSKNPKWQG